jgi:5-methylcytosine-specific restriction endonuclease McrA
MRKARRMSAGERKAKMETNRKLFGDNCWLCGLPIDFDLPRLHPKAWSLDHIVPRGNGGTNANPNIRLAHRQCNHSRGSKALDAPRPLKEVPR